MKYEPSLFDVDEITRFMPKFYLKLGRSVTWILFLDFTKGFYTWIVYRDIIT